MEFLAGLLIGAILAMFGASMMQISGRESQNERERMLRHALSLCMKFYYDEEMIFPQKEINEALRM